MPTPPGFIIAAASKLHRALITLSGGRIGWRIAGMPVLEVHTIGRRTREPRPVILTAPIRLGDGWVVVASKGGSDSHPAWYYNLLENPQVQVVMSGSAPVEMTARLLDSTERADVWPKVVKAAGNYGDYATRTSREIPLFVLEPTVAR